MLFKHGHQTVTTVSVKLGYIHQPTGGAFNG